MFLDELTLIQDNYYDVRFCNYLIYLNNYCKVRVRSVIYV